MFNEYDELCSIRLSSVKLNFFMSKVFKLAGMDSDSLESVVDGLIYASMRGIDSHGIRLFPHYVESLRRGTKNGNPSYEVVQSAPTRLSVDANGAFGLAAGRYALSRAEVIARQEGVCVVVLGNSTHPAALSAIISQSVRKGFIVFAFANADSLMTNHGGKKPFFGTNPFAFGAPAESGADFMLDMATTQFTWNKVKIYRDRNLTLPRGVAVDENGSETTDPHRARALLPSGYHKGFAMGAMVEILTGILAGGLISPEIAPMYNEALTGPRELSQAYIVIDPGTNKRFGSLGSGVDFLASSLGRSEDLQEVGLPGSMELAFERERARIGIPVDESTMERFIQIGREYEVVL